MQDALAEHQADTAATRVPQVSTAATHLAVDTRGYPRQRVLPLPAVNPDDAAIRLGLTPYHAIAPKLNALQAKSRRVSAEVIATSQLGRSVYLVTVTAPETAEEAAAQARMAQKIKRDPAAAAQDEEIRSSYKAPVFVNANIHGNEWEGTDASLRTIERLATSSQDQVLKTLRTSRLYFVVSMNPDGRAMNTRENGAGFNMNRDFVTATQPETRAVRDALIATQPLVMLDLHGYVNGTLIEPTTPPHGENYEYDLFIKHAYPNALGMERAINALGYTPDQDGVHKPVIPFRDWDEGWDDWPPIFTPQYAAFHGAVAHTIEFPMQVNRSAYENLPVGELQRRARINTDIADAAVRAGVRYAVEHRRELVADQIEVFRRGAAGEAAHPPRVGMFGGLLGPEDIYTTTYPRAYVIPAGRTQRSATAARRLVDFLIANDVTVRRADAPVWVDGRTWPAGSYVVDMHQAKRGMANVILDRGSDISDRVDAMYDISGWSHGLLWGATVDRAEGTRLAMVGSAVGQAAPVGSASGTGDLAMRLDDPAELTALNDLLGAGVAVRWTNRGEVVVPAESLPVARRVAHSRGVQMRPASARTGQRLAPLTIAAAAPAEELWALAEMGFTVRPVSTKALNDGARLEGVDTLYVSAGLNYGKLSDGARAELGSFLRGGGGVVTSGGNGYRFNTEAGLLAADLGRGRWDANGVVKVDNAGGPITAGGLPHSFVYSPLWFTDLGAGVMAEQKYANDPLVSGHWRADENGRGGPQAAAGQASVVRGVDETGAGVVMFGTQPLFRAHPKGLFAQVGRALVWSTTVNR